MLKYIPGWYYPIAAGVTLITISLLSTPPPYQPDISVAFVGNSMMYYNDFPRLMEALSEGHISQDSCLHGDATIRTMLHTGNGMYPKFMTANAVIDLEGSSYIYNRQDDDETIVIHDYGACTVRQLFFGEDARLPDQEQLQNYYDDYFSVDDDNDEYYIDDGTNPCFEDVIYLDYQEAKYMENPPQWDYLVINDNTRSPARNNTRQASLQELETYYVPWLLQSGMTPIFLFTHAYWTDWRDMTGLEDVPTFTSLTYMGYRQYAELLQQYLPYAQTPRIAPVGIAFLLVWEENYSMWEKLFHIDQVHASPFGSFLQACVVFHTLYGKMPKPNVALREDMSQLWLHARRMQPNTHQSNPYPTREEAAYLYNVAERVVRGHWPKSLTVYQDGEASTYEEKTYDDNNARQ